VPQSLLRFFHFFCHMLLAAPLLRDKLERVLAVRY
jgi:hypothetical protein